MGGFVMKTVLTALVSLMILGTYGLASASSITIEADSDWIKGSANAAALGQVLEQLAERVGCDVYIDTPLLEAPVSFTIKENLTPEKAIQRIVRPHSYAMVFGTEGTGNEPRILEVWVFRKGEQHNASYVPLKRDDSASDSSSSPMLTGSDSMTPPDTQTGVSRAVEGKDLVRRDLHVGKSAFGTPVAKGREKRTGPDYRPSAHQMRLAYERYRLAKHREERRLAEMSIRQARANAERDRQVTLAKRNEELKDQILKMTQK
jgi:hypothetical protein